MSSEFESLVAQHASHGVLVDTNLLLLFLIGLTRRPLIREFKRTRGRGLGEGDFDLLVTFLSSFHRQVTTPHILAEVSNLGGQLREPDRTTFYRVLAYLLQGEGVREEFVPSATIAQNDAFQRLGVTDCGILELHQPRLLVATDDHELYHCLAARGRPVINFNQIRAVAW